MEACLLIVDRPRPGPHNMAADEALMESVAAGRRGPTLRLYQWRPACLSLGVFQRFAEWEQLPPDARPPDVVRRITGGGAIWHDREWTYSLHLPRNHRLNGPDPAPLYRAVHGALIAGLHGLGVETRLRGEAGPAAGAAGRDEALFCFTRGDPSDIVAGDGRKIVGSAQRRLESAVLQHGSIVLETPPGSPSATSVADRLGRPADDAAVLEVCLAALARHLEFAWRPDTPADAEQARAAELVVSKHAHPEWLARR